MKAKRFHPQTSWIKASDGTTYICPVNVDTEGLSDEELRRLCVDESENPQNN